MDEIRNKVVLVGLNSPVLKREENADEESMAELTVPEPHTDRIFTGLI